MPSGPATCRGASTGWGSRTSGAELNGQIFRGGAPAARFWSMTWEHVYGRIEAMGLPYKSVQAGQAALADPQRWFHGPVRVGPWGRA